jgi:hypothetical protein
MMGMGMGCYNPVGNYPLTSLHVPCHNTRVATFGFHNALYSGTVNRLQTCIAPESGHLQALRVITTRQLSLMFS